MRSARPRFVAKNTASRLKLLLGLGFFAIIGCADGSFHTDSAPALDKAEVDRIREKTQGGPAFKKAIMAKLMEKEGLEADTEDEPKERAKRRRSR